VVFINTRLKVSPEPSHTGLLMTMSQSVMEAQGVSVEHIRAADPPHHVHRPRRRFDHRIDAAVKAREDIRRPHRLQSARVSGRYKETGCARVHSPLASTLHICVGRATGLAQRQFARNPKENSACFQEKQRW
jgi:hypothetical protein